MNDESKEKRWSKKEILKELAQVNKAWLDEKAKKWIDENLSNYHGEIFSIALLAQIAHDFIRTILLELREK